MLKASQVEQQLKRIGCNFKFWGRPELNELKNILIEGETISGCVNGRYEGGFALLCLTDHRLLLIDRKPMFLTLEDIRFDMIAEIDYNARLLESSLSIITPNKKLIFYSWNQKRLRQLLYQTQARVMELRQHFMSQQLQSAGSARGYGHTLHRAASLLGNLVLRPRETLRSAASFGYMNPYTQMPLLFRRRP